MYISIVEDIMPVPLIKLSHLRFKTLVGFSYWSIVRFLVKEKFTFNGFVLCGYLHHNLQLRQSTFLISITISSSKFGFMTLIADVIHKFPISLLLLYKLDGPRPWFSSHVGFILWNKSNAFREVTCDVNLQQGQAKASGYRSTIKDNWIVVT